MLHDTIQISQHELLLSMLAYRLMPPDFYAASFCINRGDGTLKRGSPDDCQRQQYLLCRIYWHQLRQRQGVDPHRIKQADLFANEVEPGMQSSSILEDAG